MMNYLIKNHKKSKATNIMNQHFGKYLVLYANLKTENSINSYFSTIDKTKEIIYESFELHNYF